MEQFSHTIPTSKDVFFVIAFICKNLLSELKGSFCLEKRKLSAYYFPHFPCKHVYCIGTNIKLVMAPMTLFGCGSNVLNQSKVEL